MIEVEISNFQSIEHVVLPINGFTTLVGRSNIGKTAVIRAVKSALTGRAGNNFVRHGATCARLVGQKKCKCFASVHIKAPGLDLLWEKGDAVNRYIVNGTTYDKVERGTPSFLSPDFLPLRVSDKQVLLQVADQFRPIFLLDASGPAVADTLSDVARLDQINVASRLADKDLRDARATLKVRRKDVQGLQEGLDTYEGLDDAARPVDDVQKRLEGLQGLQGSLSVLQQYTSQIKDKALDLRYLEGLGDIVIPDIARLEGLWETFDWIAVRLGTLRRFKRFFKSRPPIGEPPEPQALLNALKDFEKVRALHRRHSALDSEVSTAQTDFEEGERQELEAQAELDALGYCPTCMKPLE